MASQKSAAKRRSSATAMKPAKAASKSGRKVKRNKALAKKSAKKNRQSKKSKKTSAAYAEEEELADDEVDVDDDDFSDVIENAGFDEATMAEAGDAFAEGEDFLAQGLQTEAADAFIYGHELMAYEAELAAADYEADGEVEQADSIRLFASKHTEAAEMLRAKFPKAGDAEQAADDGDDEADVDDVDDDVAQQPRAQRATGFFGKMKANRAARATFKQMTREDAGMLGEYKRLNSEKRSWKTGFFTGMSVTAMLKGGLLVLAGTAGLGSALAIGLGAVGVGSAAVHEYKLRDSSRKQLVKDLYSSGELEPHEIQTYQAAGWL
jgi:hypothetical protein